jgi:hypothetical protein
MKKDITASLLATKLITLTLWPVSAYAAQLTFGEELAKIPVLSFLMTFILSSLLGITAVLHTMLKELQTNGQIKYVWLSISARMFGSISAGLMMFFYSDTLSIPLGYKALAIMGAAFSGTVLIEKWVKSETDKRLGAE